MEGNFNMAFPDLFVFFFVFHPFLLTVCNSSCPKSFACQNLEPLEFPLTKLDHPECGLIKIDCDSSSPPKLKLGDEGAWYDFMNIDFSSNKIMVRDITLEYNLNNRNCSSFRSTLFPNPYISFIISPSLSLFKCDRPFIDQKLVEDYFKNYKNYSDCQGFTLYYRNPADGGLFWETDHPSECLLIPLPMNANENWSNDLFKLLTYEYTIEWHVSDYEQGKTKINVILVAGVSVASLIITVSSVLLIFFRKKLPKSLALQKAHGENHVDIELFLKNHGNLAPKRYKYSQLKKITNSFVENLGKGGFGSVYKGKLQDECLVAIKILSESKGNGEEFINEVSSISRTSHVNVVALLGFCFEGSKRALIYEFMPNGSLEKFIPNTSSLAPKASLGLEKMFEIAVGIARGLEYLHQGCNMRILHFDIKPHNILLDKDFKPKISDFGLSKLCPNRSSIVSMLGARGTAGYIAPEVFCRNFGEVSHKSDVYSYGMMILEMVVGRQNNIDPQGERSSEMYFSDWIYKNLEQNIVEKDFVVNSALPENERNYVKRKLIIIALWCIQTDPKYRPSISRVIEMFEAKLESLQLPPMPHLYSPPIISQKLLGSESKPL